MCTLWTFSKNYSVTCSLPSRLQPNVSQRNGHCGENLFQMAATTRPENRSSPRETHICWKTSQDWATSLRWLRRWTKGWQKPSFGMGLHTSLRGSMSCCCSEEYLDKGRMNDFYLPIVDLIVELRGIPRSRMNRTASLIHSRFLGHPRYFYLRRHHRHRSILRPRRRTLRRLCHFAAHSAQAATCSSDTFWSTSRGGKQWPPVEHLQLQTRSMLPPLPPTRHQMLQRCQVQ